MDQLGPGALATGQELDELPVGEDEPFEVERHPASAGALGRQELNQLRQVLLRRPPGQGIGHGGCRVGSGFDSQHQFDSRSHRFHDPCHKAGLEESTTYGNLRRRFVTRSRRFTRSRKASQEISDRLYCSYTVNVTQWEIWMATVRLDIKTETALKRLSVRRGQQDNPR